MGQFESVASLNRPRYLAPMIITVQNLRRERDSIVATVLDGAVVREQRFSGDDAATVAVQWERSRFDRERYAAMPPEFPTPPGIPIHLPD